MRQIVLLVTIMSILVCGCSTRDNFNKNDDDQVDAVGLSPTYTISANHDFLTNYGLRYPVTYAFAVKTEYLIYVYHRHSSNESWQLLNAMTEPNYNGIEGFETINSPGGTKMVYVSVAFSENSDHIMLLFSSSSSLPYSNLPVQFLGVCEQYACRSVAFTISADDWSAASNKYFEDDLVWFRDKGEWLTAGVITNWCDAGAPWKEIQAQLDAGYLEVAAHSVFHNSCNIDPNEVADSKAAILKNLILPPPFSRAGREYLYTWIEPCGITNERLRASIAAADFLVDRSTNGGYYGIDPWADDGLFRRMLITTYISPNIEVETLNSYFDQVRENGGIYRTWYHPWEGVFDKVQSHVAYVDGFTGVWHASLGQIASYLVASNAIRKGTIGFRTGWVWFSSADRQRVWSAHTFTSKKAADFIGIASNQNPDLTDGIIAGVLSLGSGSYTNIKSLHGNGFPTNQGWFSVDYCRRVWPVDVDGDDKDDILGIQNSGNIFVMKAQGDSIYDSWRQVNGYGFPESQGWLTAGVTQRIWPVRSGSVLGQDILGIGNDGNIFKMKAIGSGNYGIYGQVSGWGFPQSQGWFSNQYRERVWPADVDRDRRTEIIGIGFSGNVMVMDDDGNGGYKTWVPVSGYGFPTSDNWFSTQYAQRVWPADVNGDGYMDVVGISFNGQIVVLPNNGDGTFGMYGPIPGVGFPSDTNEEWFGANYSDRVFPADVDGDGDDDIVGFAKDGSIWMMYADGWAYSGAVRLAPITVN